MLLLHEEAHLHQIRELITECNWLNSIDKALTVTTHLGETFSERNICVQAECVTLHLLFIEMTEIISYVIGNQGATTTTELLYFFAPNRKYDSWKLFDALNIQSLVGVPPRETPGNDPFEGWAVSMSSSSHNNWTRTKSATYTTFHPRNKMS